ncbi:MAG: LTA synthase family protein [Acidobacteria bacterium]|nr:LTA synthase family protein [Acidobacteriota bacterium]MCB9398235.1 LTA synthase family protein [Acidobacteriota bacterium]
MGQKEKWYLLEKMLVLAILGLLIFIEQHTLTGLIQKNPLQTRESILNVLKSLSTFFPDFHWRYGPYFLVIGLIMSLTPRLRWFLLAVFSSFSVLLVIGDLVYYRFFDSFADVKALALLGQAVKVRSSAFAEMPWSYYLYFIPLYALIALGYRVAVRVDQSEVGTESQKKRFVYMRIFLVLILVFLGIKMMMNAKIYYSSIKLEGVGKKETFVPPYQNSDKEFCLIFGLSNYFWRSTYQKFFPQTIKISEEQVADAYQLLSTIKKNNEQPTPLLGSAKGLNVILISVEALQSFVIHAEYGGQEITPFINQIAREGICFDLTIDNGLKGGTSDGELASLTGLLPDPRSLSSHIYPITKDLLGIPKHLRQFGYATISMHGNEGNFWERRKSHVRLGFQKSYFEESFQTKAQNGLGLLDGDFFRESSQILIHEQEPFFCFMISLTAHHPYTMVPDDVMPISSLPAPLTIGYLRSQHYFDREFSKFVEQLGDIAQRTVFVLYGDHMAPGISIDAGFLKENFNLNVNSARSKLIPIIIWSPSLRGEFSSFDPHHPKSLNDIFPTLCHLLDIPVPFGVSGQNLLLNTGRLGLPLAKYNGICFEDGIYAWNGEPIFDERGFIFEGDPLDREAIGQGLVGAYRLKQMHNNLYDGNLQPILIQKYQQNAQH